MFGRKRDKVVTIRVNEKQYNAFLVTVEKFTSSYTIDYPSRSEKRYHTTFPDKPFSRYNKYTLSDLVEESMDAFVNKYNSDV